jgi:hypothetical protein
MIIRGEPRYAALTRATLRRLLHRSSGAPSCYERRVGCLKIHAALGKDTLGHFPPHAAATSSIRDHVGGG